MRRKTISFLPQSPGNLSHSICTMRHFFFFLRLFGGLSGSLFFGSATAEQTTNTVPDNTPRTQPVYVDDKIFRAVAVNPKHASLHWKMPNGQAYAGFSRLKKALTNKGRQVTVMMNAGIYSANNKPAGLHVENGKVLHPLNTRNGRGNFHLQPNGVFFITKDGTADITTTQQYQQHYSGHEKQWKTAVQSGPMLVIDGSINEKFIPDSNSNYTRNGVCTTPTGGLYFLATEYFPAVTSNLYQFARAAQQLGCNNALYLDGSISKLYVAGENSTFHFSHYVGILSVTTVLQTQTDSTKQPDNRAK